MEASEMAIRGSMHELGGALLEKLLDTDSGYRGPRVACAHRHEAEFVDYRSKSVLSVLASIRVERAYYHCTICHKGVIPKDRDLDIVDTSFSPGVRRLMARVGGKEPFDEGRVDLEELAGIKVKTKEVERTAEAVGTQIETAARKERKAALAGKVVMIHAVSKMYVAIDGTGVPMVPHETQGRCGKDGVAKTREAKLGCVFTQTGLDQKGRPVRDEASTSYVGAIETAEEFGRRIFTEAIRRGSRRAEQMIILGDGAHWIWNLADEHFPGAIQIVDLYHAREHLSELAKVLYGPGTAQAKTWSDTSIAILDAGKPEKIVSALELLCPETTAPNGALPWTAAQLDALRKTTTYFRNNAPRMRYDLFRSLGLFVGSGVVEAGCRTVVGRRLKQSGMHWTVCGANAIIAVRCCDLSGRWESFWEARAS
jgi:hypothetical protein